MKKILISLLLIPFLVLTSHAQAKVQIDETIPSAIKLQDQMGIERDLSSLYGDKGLVLVFVRSADWCPYCKKQLSDLNLIHKDVLALGYNIVSISYDSVPLLYQFAQEKTISYPMLSDTGSAVIRQFGILNPDMKIGTRFYGVPVPQTYIIDTSGMVKDILEETSYEYRPSNQELLNALKDLK